MSNLDPSGYTQPEWLEKVISHKADTMRCPQCRTPMTPEVAAPYKGVGWGLIIVGVLLLLFINIILGLILGVMGIPFAAIKRRFWQCRACGAQAPRF
jgi:hypothetical protein